MLDDNVSAIFSGRRGSALQDGFYLFLIPGFEVGPLLLCLLPLQGVVQVGYPLIVAAQDEVVNDSYPGHTKFPILAEGTALGMVDGTVL